MANIKISELNELSKVDRTDILPIVDVSANETKKVLVDNLIEKNIELLAISDTVPSEFEDGDKYYNTSTKKIYTAVDGSWSETGETPLDGLFYILFNEQSSYAWNGSDLVSVGGGKEDIVISDTEPTDPDVKLWIDTGEVGESFTEITNEYSTSTGKGYSASYINNLHTYSTDEILIGTWIDGKPLYRKVYFFDNLPSNAITEIADVSGLNIDNMPHLYGMAQTPLNYSSLSKRPLPFAGGGNDDIRLDIDNGKLRVKTYSNWSAFIRNYIVLEYTKTTD